MKVLKKATLRTHKSAEHMRAERSILESIQQVRVGNRKENGEKKKTRRERGRERERERECVCVCMRPKKIVSELNNVLQC